MGDRVVWLLAADGASDMPPGLPGAPAFERAVAAAKSLGAAMAALCPVAVEIVADPAAVEPGPGALLVAGPPAYVEPILRRLMGMPDTSARFPLVPGSPAIVQLLPDRAVLTRLNAGRALD